MNNGNEILFSIALGIEDPLYIKRIDFNEDKELHIYIDFKMGSKFRCPICGKNENPVHDTKDNVWRHLNFFQYKSFIHFRTPRTKCPIDGVHIVNPPWSGKNDFTLLMDAMIVEMSKHMPVNRIALLLDENDTKIWRVIKNYVNKAQAISDFKDVRNVGLDETSYKKGHKYITSFVDMHEKRVIYVTEGKSSEVIAEFKEELPYHNAHYLNIRSFSIDMSPAFIKGISENFPIASITFDKFHVVKLANEAVDETRRMDQRENSELKKTRYLWLKNPDKLTDKQKEQIESLSSKKMKTGKAYRIKLELQEIYQTSIDRIDAAEKLQKLYNWAIRSRIEPMKVFARTLKSHMEGILQYFDSRLTNGVLEGMNGVIQSIKARARGFRNVENLIAMVYLVLGKLEINFIPPQPMF